MYAILTFSERSDTSDVVAPFYNLNEDVVKDMLDKLVSVYAIFADKGATPLMKLAWK